MSAEKKNQLKLPIEGVLREYEIADIPLESIELDEDNPRIGYFKDNLLRSKDKTSQEDIAFGITAFKSDDYNKLKTSIEVNEGIVSEIVVMRKGDKFLCIDGNTRVLIYRELKEKYPNRQEWKKIKAKIFPANINDREKNFIRLMAHLRGVNEWEVYERARLLYILWYNKGYTEQQLQYQTKLSLNNIRRWREAYRIMSEQFLPKYSSKPDAFSKFSYFVEYENPKIKNGMKRYGMDVNEFVEWVGTDEIKRGQDVRLLKNIFDDKGASEILRTKGFEAAKEELERASPAFGSELFVHVDKCIIGLKKMSREEELEIKGEKSKKRLNMLIDLHKQLDSFANLDN